MATDNKYDRQLRLWGHQGQKKLSFARILLINATPLGTEALKNLVLPGVGYFSICDDTLVTEQDCGNNFFVTLKDIGKNKAKVATELLAEMNPDVKCDYQLMSVTELLKKEEYIRNFNLVIATKLTQAEMLKLNETCAKEQVSIIFGDTFGLIGYLRIFKAEHLVIESKPDGKELEDLRLNNPFPSLSQYANTIDFNALPAHLHSHIPYIIILLHGLHEYLVKYNGLKPKTTEEKDVFRAIIKDMARDYEKQENFIEAYNNAYKCFISNDLPGAVEDILMDPKCTEKTIKEPFWLLAAALKVFYETYQCLPLNGKIPDMTADTDSFLKLQKIYQEQANADLLKFKEILNTIIANRGLDIGLIEEEHIELFCGNTQTLELWRFRTIEEEYKNPNKDDVQMEFYNEESLIDWYLLIRGAQIFNEQNAYYPGHGLPHESYLDDLEKFKLIMDDVMKQYNGEEKHIIPENKIKEILRFGHSEIHNVCAFVGGVIAQEVIKLITEQYTPSMNTFIYSAIHAIGQSFDL